MLLSFGLILASTLRSINAYDAQKLLRESYFTTNPIDKDFDSLVEETLRHLHIPGMSIAVVDGQDTYAKVPTGQLDL